MARVVLSGLADLDINFILIDLAAKAGNLVAARYDGLFNRLYDRLADLPNSGAARPALGEDIRIGIVAPFIIIYRYAEDGDTVTVLRVVDGRRRISGRMLPRG
jgi:toxin ParE1/3/4